jgi:hypothetical protein
MANKFQFVQTCSGAHRASYPMDTGYSFSVDKAGRSVKLTTPTSTEAKKTWIYTS